VIDLHSKLLAQAAAILLLGLHGVEQRQLDDVGPDGRTRAATQTAVDTPQTQIDRSQTRTDHRHGPTTDTDRSQTRTDHRHRFYKPVSVRLAWRVMAKPT